MLGLKGYSHTVDFKVLNYSNLILLLWLLRVYKLVMSYHLFTWWLHFAMTYDFIKEIVHNILNIIIQTKIYLHYFTIDSYNCKR